jgi:hypothetical protein
MNEFHHDDIQHFYRFFQGENGASSIMREHVETK